MCSLPEAPRRLPPGSSRRLAGLAAAVLALSVCAGTRGAERASTLPVATKPAPSDATLDLARARTAVAEMRATYHVGRRTERQLRWIPSDAPQERNASLDWLIQAVHWLADAARWTMWLLGAGLVLLLAVFGRRWARVADARERRRTGVAPSHLHALDIRPASLPADVAAAARRLLQRGEGRAALSLLYRGTLSRLVYDHDVPVRAGHTEGECLQLARQSLSPAGARGFERLVAAWQSEVYADRRTATADLAALCDAYDEPFAPARGGGRVIAPGSA